MNVGQGNEAQSILPERTGRILNIDTMETIPNIVPTGNVEQENRTHEEALKSLQELIESIKKNIRVHDLQIAIGSLQDALDKGKYDEGSRAVIRYHLVTALLTRFGVYRWIEDLDACSQHLKAIGNIAKFVGKDGDGSIPEVQQAAQAIRGFGNSLNIDVLATVVCAATESISSYASAKATSGPDTQRGSLLIMLGNTFVMRYLNCRGVADLDKAATNYQDGERICVGNAPIAYNCLMSLAHVEWLRYIEHGTTEGLDRVRGYMERAKSIDDEGSNLVLAGAKMAAAFPTDEARLQFKIAFLSTSLKCRKAPHFRRPSLLHDVAHALLTRFQQRGKFRDLEECILLGTELVELWTVPHPNRASSLDTLSKALFKRFQRLGNLQDLQDSIVMQRESLELQQTSPALLGSLAVSLITRFKQQNNNDDLEEAISLARESLSMATPSHPYHSSSLRNLAAALSTRFQQRGTIQDLEECIELERKALDILPVTHPDRPASLNNLANSIHARFAQTGVLQDLEETIALHQEALDLRPAPHPRRFPSLNNLAEAISTRFEQKGAIEDLEKCISLHQEALSLLPAQHPDRSASLNNLANSFYTRFLQKGVFQDLETSLDLHQQALNLRPVPHTQRASSLTNLATTLRVRYEQKGLLEDLEKCITVQQEALPLLSEHHPDRSTALDNLGHALLTRFQQKGSMHDLEESIIHRRKAVDLQPASRPGRSLPLTNLAASVFTRFTKKGAFQDLQECIVLCQEALALLPPLHSDRSLPLNNLANALLTSFEEKGALQDLEKCIQLYREALDLRPAPHSERSLALHNLANSLFRRFEHKGDLEDIEECIDLHQEAIKLRSKSHADRSFSLNNLANAMCTRFEQKGTFQDLEECITIYREALDLRSAAHPDRSSLMCNLANALSRRFREKGASQDLEESITLYLGAIDLQPKPHPDRPSSLRQLAGSLYLRFQHEQHIEDLDRCIALHQEALDSLHNSHSARALSLSHLANSLTMRFEQKGNLQDIEKAIALHQEALDLRPAAHPNRSMSLNNLANSLIMRFVLKGALQDLEKGILLHQSALDLRPAPHPNRTESLRNLAHCFSARFQRREGFYDSHHDSSLANTLPSTLHGPLDSEEDLYNALNLFEEASKYETGSLLDRFYSSKDWADLAQKHHPVSAIDAYRYAIQLLPLLASLDLTLEQRQDVLRHSREIVGDAAKCAINADQYDVAVALLSTGRSVFWSQALQLRLPVDKLMVTNPALAEEFMIISRKLENASYSNLDPLMEPIGVEFSTDKYTSLYALADQRRRIIEEIRRIPDYEDFLLPPPFPSLQSAAESGPIVLLNASRLGCDALIMCGTGSVNCIPLSDVHLKVLDELKILMNTLLGTGLRSVDISQDTAVTLQALLGRDMARKSLAESNQETFRLLLECLWFKIVKPVIEVLGIEKTSSPRRVWWCPTGPFTALPIHAAGIYSEDNSPVDCLFQYAVSSYCTSPQDLLYPPLPIAQDFRITAIMEPEAPGAASLPAAHAELKEIEKHVPSQQHLLTHVGSKETPNKTQDLFNDIQRSSFVHFGCHGKQNLDNPLESFLLLSGGKLTMYELIKKCQVPDGALAYLSACETAKGDEVRPDESLNLVATMMFAGFRSVVGTMWSIVDEDAPVAASAFYSHLFRKGKDPLPDVRDAAYGLHIATKELRAKGKPFHSWVPYVHYGI